MTADEVRKVLESHGFHQGRMISPYKEAPKGHLAIWNANIVTWTHKKVWYGDLDLTKEGTELKKVATQIKEPLYILYEMDARFGEENRPIEHLIGKAAWSTEKDVPGVEK